METSGSRASKRVCATTLVVGDMVAGVCSRVLGDITVKYLTEGRFVDSDERYSALIQGWSARNCEEKKIEPD